MSTYHREPRQAGALKAGSLQGGQKSLSGELSNYSPTILWLSMPILVSSWIRRSVSYKLCKCKLTSFGSIYYIDGTMTIGKLKTDMGRRKGRHLRNSAIQTQTKVVAAGSRNCALTCKIQDQGFVHPVGPKHFCSSPAGLWVASLLVYQIGGQD